VQEAEAYADYVREMAGEEQAAKLPPYRALPMQALDHAAGYLLAFGIAAALCKTVTVRLSLSRPIYPLTDRPNAGEQEGGSWRVRVSLSATLLWIRRFGNLHPVTAFDEGLPLPPRVVPPDPEVAAVSTTIERDRGDFERREGGVEGQRMSVIRHAATLTGLGIREGKAPMRLDAHRPEWLPRS
jgi:hypothetical protein